MSDQQVPPVFLKPKGDSALRGCMIGCLAVFAGLLVLCALVGFVAYNAFSRVLDEFTSPTPVEIPAVVMTEEQKELLFGKVDMFSHQIDGNGPLETLELTADEINVLLRDYPGPGQNSQWVRVDIVDDILRAEVSLPLEQVGLGDRYLNGAGELIASLNNGQLNVIINSFEVDGQPLPGQALAVMRNLNLAQNFTQDPSAKQALALIDTIEVRDGKLIITPKAQ